MASFLDKFKITTGIDTNTKLDLSCQHITTADFMHMQPVYIKEMVPGETLKVHQETFARMAPLMKPMFGRALIHNRAFFVPMRTLWKDWTDFITNVITPQQLVRTSSGYVTPLDAGVENSKVPYILNSAFTGMFLGEDSNTAAFVGISQSGSNQFVKTLTTLTQSDIAMGYYDIQCVYFDGVSTTGTSYYFKLTNLGRRVLKILESLGYKPVWVFAKADSTALQHMDARIGSIPDVSALPLFSFLKIVLDWYYPTQYVGDGAYNKVASLLKTVCGPGVDGNVVSANTLRDIFTQNSGNNCFKGLVNYDSDYFVSAFDNPNGASIGGNPGIIIKDVNDANLQVVDYPSTSAGNNYAMIRKYFNGSGQAMTSITQYALDALKGLTDYMKRHQLVGARALDRYFARFGKSLSSEKLDRCNYIGSQNIPLQVADVMSHAETDSGYLGEYAGKGIAFGADGNYEFTTDEYGYFVIISSIVPQIGYYQGMDRTVLHTGRLDFWTPEFDQMGNQAISKLEVDVPMNGKLDAGVSDIRSFYNPAYPLSGIFGYTPRYSEYKIGRDKLTGDWRYGGVNQAGDVANCWHLFRNMATDVSSTPDLVHKKNFVIGADAGQFNRIFQVVGESEENSTLNADKFYMIHNFNVISESPMHSLYDTYKFGNEDEGAKKVVGDVNGVKVN